MLVYDLIEQLLISRITPSADVNSTNAGVLIPSINTVQDIQNTFGPTTPIIPIEENTVYFYECHLLGELPLIGKPDAVYFQKGSEGILIIYLIQLETSIKDL